VQVIVINALRDISADEEVIIHYVHAKPSPCKCGHCNPLNTHTFMDVVNPTTACDNIKCSSTLSVDSTHSSAYDTSDDSHSVCTVNNQNRTVYLPSLLSLYILDIHHKYSNKSIVTAPYLRSTCAIHPPLICSVYVTRQRILLRR
jgi:hypothetical protein